MEKIRAREQARAQLKSIIKLVAALESKHDGAAHDGAAGDYAEKDAVIQAIQESPLSVEVRSCWHVPGGKDFQEASEYKILLCTGGPAVRLIGDLDNYWEPVCTRLEFSDWGTGWEYYLLTEEEESTVLAYCRQFYFGG